MGASSVLLWQVLQLKLSHFFPPLLSTTNNFRHMESDLSFPQAFFLTNWYGHSRAFDEIASLIHHINHCHCQQHHQHKQHQQDLISAPSPTSWPGTEGWTDGFGQGATWWWRSHPPQVCFAPLLLKTVSLVFDTLFKIIVFRIRRLRLEDGGLFITARYNRMLWCPDDSLLEFPSLIC